MKLRVAVLMCALFACSMPDSLARGGGGGGGHGGGGGGHGGGGGGHFGGGGGGYHGGGGGWGGGGYSGRSIGTSMGYISGGGGGGGRGWGNDPGGGWGNHDYGYGYGYGGYGYGYGGGGYYGNNAITNAPVPYTPPSDPLADYYRQQAAISAAAQAPQTNVTASIAPYGGGSLGTAITAPNSSSTSLVDVGNEVRDNFHGSGIFSAAWWKGYKNAWYNPSWPDAWVWNNVDWSTLAPFMSLSAGKPAGEYDYGDNVKFEGGTVYFGSQPMEKEAVFYQQAQVLAAKGKPKLVAGAKVPAPATADWQPLGVFSLVRDSQKFSTTLMQLAINKQGLVRGNCYNVTTGQLTQITGAADKSNSRVAFTAGTTQNVVFDSGIGNLLNAQSSVMVHMSKDQHEQMTLVRLRKVSI